MARTQRGDRPIRLLMMAVGLAVAIVAAFTLVDHGGNSKATPDGESLSVSGGSSPTVAPNVQKVDRPPPTTVRPRRTVTMAFSGDLLIHSAVYNQAKTYGQRSGKTYDFAPMFDKVRPLLSAADVAICHQETAINPDERFVAGFPLFSTPPQILDAVKTAGYDGCSTASNHSLDRGAQGVIDTADLFDRAGLKQSGLVRTADERGKATLYTVNGVTIAHLAYSYGLNGLLLPPDKPWLVNLIDAGKESNPSQAYTSQFILADTRAARVAGASIVVVSLQWGAEYQSTPTAAQVQLARELTAWPDINLVVGHHVHVVQPIDKVGNKYVVYGVGNFLSNQSPAADPTLPAASQDGVIVEVSFEESLTDNNFSATGVAYTPTWVDRTNGYVITPVAAALKDPATPAATKAQLQASWQRTTTAINALGAADKGVTPSASP